MLPPGDTHTHRTCYPGLCFARTTRNTPNNARYPLPRSCATHPQNTHILYCNQTPCVLSKMELILAYVLHPCIVPYISDEKTTVDLFLLSGIILDKGTSMLGTLRTQRLDKIQRKLYVIPACLGSGCEPINLDSSSDSEAKDPKNWIGHPQKTTLPFLSPHNPNRKGGFWGGVQRVRAELKQR